MDLKPPSSSKSQGTRALAPQEQTLTISADAAKPEPRETCIMAWWSSPAELCRNALLVPRQGLGVLNQILLVLLHIGALPVDDTLGALHALLDKPTRSNHKFGELQDVKKCHQFWGIVCRPLTDRRDYRDFLIPAFV